MSNGFEHQTLSADAGIGASAEHPNTNKDDIEKRLAGIWQELLGIPAIGPDENYFDLGADSAMTVQLFAQVEKVFKVNIPIPALFEAPTIREFASVIRKTLSERKG